MIETLPHRARFRLAAFLALAALSAGPLAAANSDATYSNPLLPTVEMADPHVIRVGGTYYLYATTHTRGYDVYTSTNLVDWENKGSVFTDPRGGIWAPDVFHDLKGSGNYYLYYTANLQNRSRKPLEKVIGVAEAASPMGPFKDRGVLANIAIDAHMFEEDAKYYLYYVDLDGGFKIMVQCMKDPVEKTGTPRKVIEPTEPWEMKSGNVTEGPFVLKRGATYYLMYSGTGADSPNYGIGYATASSPLGPFRKHPGNPIVKRHKNVLGPGHHCVIEGPDSQLWLVYHQKWEDNQSFHRFLALDRLWFEPNGVIKAEATRDVVKPRPGFAPAHEK